MAGGTFQSSIMNIGFMDGNTKSMPNKQYWRYAVTGAGQRVMAYLWPNEAVN